jgi:hypothetical protein
MLDQHRPVTLFFSFGHAFGLQRRRDPLRSAGAAPPCPGRAPLAPAGAAPRTGRPDLPSPAPAPATLAPAPAAPARPVLLRYINKLHLLHSFIPMTFSGIRFSTL